MLNVHTFFRWSGTGLAITVLGGLMSGPVWAGGFHLRHGGAVSGVSFVPAISAVQVVSSPAPVLTTAIAAPVQLQVVGQVQYQAVSAPLQSSLVTTVPNVSTTSGTVLTSGTSLYILQGSAPQNLMLISGTSSNQGSQVGSAGKQPVLSESQLLFQQQALQQLETSGWLKTLQERLAQKLRDQRTLSGGILPSRDVLVKLLLDEAFALLRNTPFGPIFAILQPGIERLIDNLISREQQVGPTPRTEPTTPVPTGGEPTTPVPTGGVKRYMVTVQELGNDKTQPGDQGPDGLPQRKITNDQESPNEDFAPPPGNR